MLAVLVVWVSLSSNSEAVAAAVGMSLAGSPHRRQQHCSSSSKSGGVQHKTRRAHVMTEYGASTPSQACEHPHTWWVGRQASIKQFSLHATVFFPFLLPSRPSHNLHLVLEPSLPSHHIRCSSLTVVSGGCTVLAFRGVGMDISGDLEWWWSVALYCVLCLDSESSTH